MKTEQIILSQLLQVKDASLEGKAHLTVILHLSKYWIFQSELQIIEAFS